MSGVESDDEDRDPVEAAHLQRVVDAVGDPFYSLDADGRFTYTNQAHEALTGYTTEELRGRPVSTVTDPTDTERVAAEIEDLLAADDRRTALIEVDVITKSGERIPTEVHLSLLVADDGGAEGATGIVRDIRDRKRRERELAEYEAIVETVPDGVIVIDADGIIEHANSTAAWLYDVGHDELIGQPFDRFVGGEVGEASLEDRYTDLLGSCFIAEAIGEQARYEFEATVEGERRVFETNLALRPSSEGEFRGTIGVVRDITERREHEQTLERYETIVEASGDPVYALDASGHFSFVNRAHADILGYERSELVGSHFSTVVDDADVRRGQRVIRTLLTSDDRRHTTFEVTLVTRDGERIPAENNVALLTDGEGSLRGLAGIARDLTRRKARERALERQNERLERVASVLSHDLRNPLTIAIGRVQLARDDGDGDGSVEHLDETEAALTRMSDLIDDVLSLARQGEQVVEPDPVSLRSVVDSAWHSIDGDEATLSVEGEPATIRADGSRLQRLLENLLRNAVEHAGPECTVRVGDLSGDSGFYVEDDGPGIPPHDRERTFEYGWTTSEDGTGYGLAIAKEIAEAHGWEITAAGSAEGGARFEVSGVEWVTR